MVIISNRSWLDVAIGTHGNLEGLFELVAANDTSITQLPDKGVELKSVESEKVNSIVINELQKNGIIPGTIGDPDLQSGIGYWAIEVDFEVQ